MIIERDTKPHNDRVDGSAISLRLVLVNLAARRRGAAAYSTARSGEPTPGGFKNETASVSVGRGTGERRGRVTWRRAAQRERTKRKESGDLQRDWENEHRGRTLLAWVAGCDSRSL